MRTLTTSDSLLLVDPWMRLRAIARSRARGTAADSRSCCGGRTKGERDENSCARHYAPQHRCSPSAPPPLIPGRTRAAKANGEGATDGRRMVTRRDDIGRRTEYRRAICRLPASAGSGALGSPRATSPHRSDAECVMARVCRTRRGGIPVRTG
jgi:hypothetical protein